jgi:hypothetical protein
MAGTRSVWVGLVFVLSTVLFGACAPGSGNQPGDAGSSVSDAGDVGDGVGGGDGDGGGQGDVGADTSFDFGEPGAGVAPSLSSLQAMISGSGGADISIVVIGEDPDLDATRLEVELRPAGGGATPAFDLNRDGILDSTSTVLFIDDEAERAELTAVVRLPGLNDRVPGLGFVRARLVDEANLVSEYVEVEIAQQPVRDIGASCDRSYLTDRCQDGLGCQGDPAACVVSVPPVTERAAYVIVGEAGLILATGAEPDDDLAGVRIDFYDSAGEPVMVDLDNDQITDATFVDLPAGVQRDDGTFFFESRTSESFDELVTEVGLTPFDRAENLGETERVVLAEPTLRGAGAICDPRGFDVCVEGAACLPGVPGAISRCVSLANQRVVGCRDALELRPGETVAGRVRGVGVWAPPEGCATGGAAYGEVIVRLVLDEPVAELVLDTRLPGTDFDTVVYLLDSCTADSFAAGPCADDHRGDGSADDRDSTLATLTLTNLPAGEHYVVVDSFGVGGGHFVLRAR